METRERTVIVRPEELREARRRALLTQGRLAEMAGVNVSTIERLESPTKSNGLFLGTAHALAEALGRPATELFDLEQ